MYARVATLILIFATAFSAAAEIAVPYEKFKTWPVAKRKKYVKDMARMYSEFERAANKGMKFADNSGFELPNFWNKLLPEANAQVVKYCTIGGVRRDLAKPTDPCSTKGRGKDCVAKGFQDGFKCGSVYGSVCVDRSPPDLITDRCEAANPGDISEEAYRASRQNLEGIATSCISQEMKSSSRDACTKFIARLNRLETVYIGSSSVTKWEMPAAEIVQEVAPIAPVAQVAPVANGQVPTVEALGGTNNPPVLGPCGKAECPDDRPADVMPVPEDNPPREVVVPFPRPASERPTSTGTSDCVNNQSTNLGPLACIACGMMTYNEVDTQGGVSKWLTLIGAMAQKYHGGFNPRDEASRKAFQIRVAEMIAAYGYCTDNEYDINLPNGSKDWITNRNALADENNGSFANTFELRNDRRLTLFGPELAPPYKYIKEIFNVGQNWSRHTPHYHQWRFRSMIKAQSRNFDTTAFAGCAQAVERRMRNLRPYGMCPVEDENWRRPDRPLRMQGDEYKSNESFFSHMVKSCGHTVTRNPINEPCREDCVQSTVWRRIQPNLPNCRGSWEPPGCTSNCDPDDPGKPGEPGDPRDPPTDPPVGKPSEPTESRPDAPTDTGKGGEEGIAR